MVWLAQLLLHICIAGVGYKYLFYVKYIKQITPDKGLEPSTTRLKVWRSTN